MNKTQRPDRYEYWQDCQGNWWWHRKAPNGRIIAGSTEGYRQKSRCLSMIARDQGGAPGSTVAARA